MDSLLPTDISPAETKPAPLTETRSALIKKIKRMKYCSEVCPAFDYCPAMPTAINNETDPKKPCVLKTMGPKLRKRFERLFLEGQDGLITELRDSIYQVGFRTDMSMDLSDKRAYAQLLNQTIKTLYGDRPEAATPQQTTITVNVLNLEDTLKDKVIDADFDEEEVEEDDEE